MRGWILEESFSKRRHPDLNWGSKICNLLPYHLAISPILFIEFLQVHAFIERDWRDSNPQLPSWQGGALTGWTTISSSIFEFYNNKFSYSKRTFLKNWARPKAEMPVRRVPIFSEIFDNFFAKMLLFFYPDIFEIKVFENKLQNSDSIYNISF